MLKNTEIRLNSTVPIISDVIRIIDGYEFVRCSYLSLQSDSPIPNWNIILNGITSQILLVNLQAIVIGSPRNGSHFNNLSDIEQLYSFAENQEELFVDLNEIWVPFSWLKLKKIHQGLLLRIPAEYFSICWKFTNGTISTQILFEESENLKKELDSDTIVAFSEEETRAFSIWTEKQIQESIEIYHANREEYLTKITEK